MKQNQFVSTVARDTEGKAYTLSLTWKVADSIRL